ncbi:MAG TPA: hypothetical protein VEQ37_18680 [Actinomycetota bacterium]|nr:hypothetical protein [Actinomycetota bacterium]
MPKASFSATRAITIDASPEMVWPWIVQIGYCRAGFYTFPLLDNAGYESAGHILEEYLAPDPDGAVQRTNRMRREQSTKSAESTCPVSVARVASCNRYGAGNELHPPHT